MANVVLKKIILLNKKEGETPLETLEVFRKKHKKYKHVPITYAGRLDPMATGLLLLLAGEETKNKENYLSLDKEYEFSVLFGFATDTYDILGKVTHSNIRTNIGMKELEEKIKSNLKRFRGKFIQTYPLYSSKTVKGKQLFEYARAGQVVDAPTREVLVKKLTYLSSGQISSKKLLQNIERRIKKVNGDFRQKEILQAWQKYLHTSTLKWSIARFKIKCSSGTYVRSISNELGKKIGIPALAFSIKRVKIGKWSKPN